MRLMKKTLTSSMKQKKIRILREKQNYIHVNLIHSYIASEAGGHVNRPPKMEELSPSQLDTYLSKFLLAVRKKNGEEYEPTTSRFYILSRTLSEKTSILRVCSHGTKLCPNKRNTEVFPQSCVYCPKLRK